MTGQLSLTVGDVVHVECHRANVELTAKVTALAPRLVALEDEAGTKHALVWDDDSRQWSIALRDLVLLPLSRVAPL